MHRILAVVLWLSLPAVAQVRGEESACNNDSTSQTTISLCARERYEKADVELNRVYNELLAGLVTNDSRNRLREAQRAWLAFRDKDCHYFNSGKDTVALWVTTSLYFSCLEGRTLSRTTELRAFGKCKQAGCPY